MLFLICIWITDRRISFYFISNDILCPYTTTIFCVKKVIVRKDFGDRNCLNVVFALNGECIGSGSKTGNGKCKCNKGWSGAECNKCDIGWGKNCTKCSFCYGGICNGSNTNTGNGECICREPFAGKNCTSCIDNYYGKNCRHKCLNKNCEKK